MAKFLQWNCRGARGNIEDIKTLLHAVKPAATCLQETFLSKDSSFLLGKCSIFRKDREAHVRGGGVAIVVSPSYPSEQVILSTHLEAVAARVYVGSVVTICSLYVPPHERICVEDLEDLLTQLPEPMLLLGDFNAHNRLWGSAHDCPRGKIIENFLLKNAVYLLNGKSPTHITLNTDMNSSCLDLSFCSPSLSPSLTWHVHENPYHSDHFPILLECSNPNPCFPARVPRWLIERAEWDSYAELAHLPDHAFNSLAIDEASEEITSILLTASMSCIPMSSTRFPEYPKPWWSAECANARKYKNACWGKFRRYPSTDNLIEFKRSKAALRRTIRQQKRTSRRRYLSKICKDTPLILIWLMVKKMSGYYPNHALSILKDGPIDVCNLADQANLFGRIFAETSSRRSCSREFQIFSSRCEQQDLRIPANRQEPYNQPFTLEELEMSLRRSRNTAVGDDNIHYSMIKHLSTSSKRSLLKFYNRIWLDGVFPLSWRRAIVLPVLKPGKDPSDPHSYRPIALTSCLCKVLERMVNYRLMYVLEKNKLLSPMQCGFRKNRSTYDHLVFLESEIRSAFVRREHLVAVFFDLARAYDTTWRYGILKNLVMLGFSGNMMTFVKNFLGERTFRVRRGTTLSSEFVQEMGVPQGCILSVTLFLVQINSISQVITSPVMHSLYADDLHISVRSSSLRTAERQLQLCINRLGKWCTQNGFSFSEKKTCAVHFTRKRGIFPDPELSLNGIRLPCQQSAKFLGLIFDRKLTFGEHIASLRKRCLRKLNLLKVLAHKSWGGNVDSLLHIYRATVRSTLDYGSFIYGSACPSTLRQLDPVHHQALRLCTGAFRTSPIDSLYIVAHEPPLSLRRSYLGISYAAKIAILPDNPAHNPTFSPRFTQLFSKRKTVMPPFGIRLQKDLAGFPVIPTDVARLPPPMPPWEQLRVCCNLTLTSLPKCSTPPIVYQQELQNILFDHKNFTPFYTDGSKTASHVGAAFVTDTETQCFKLPLISSVYTAEIYAIKAALQFISQQKVKKSLILSDSLSALTAICSSTSFHHPFVGEVLWLLHKINKQKLWVELAWVPGHVNIHGNECADKAAKHAQQEGQYVNAVTLSDFKAIAQKFIEEKWLHRWRACTDNKLFRIHPSIVPFHDCSSLPRRTSVLLTRLRIGHTRLTHAHLPLGTEAPLCDACDSPVTVLHLFTCHKYSSHLQTLLEPLLLVNTPFHPALLLDDPPLIPLDNLLRFLSNTGLIHLL